jgi:prepilin-type processing-associated H-X9-DG protein
MAIQTRLPLVPPEAVEINDTVCFVHDGDRIGYFAAGVPLFSHAADDATGRRVAAAQIATLGLAKQSELSAALGVNRTTLYRQQQRFAAEGIGGLVDEKRGPKGPHKLTEPVLERAQQMLDAGESKRATAASVGVSEGTIRNAIRQGWLSEGGGRAEVVAEAVDEKPLTASQPTDRSGENAATALGVATGRRVDRLLARAGKLEEASPQFQASMAVAGAGALVALPALLKLGLLEAGAVYERLKKGFYGLRSTLLCLAFMALLRIRTPERLQFEPPGELGVLLGLDRAPEVKTIRRKLQELAKAGKAQQFSAALAARWVKQSRRAAGVLYVDGHVRVYHGEKHRLGKAHVARRNLSMPAVTDYWVNDKNAEPLFVVTGTVNEKLIAAMKGSVLPQVRALVGPGRRVTMVFDREGWSPKWFKELDEQGFDVLSYRKGPYRLWRRSCFEKVSGQVEGRRVEYELAERTVGVYAGFRMREVRRLRSDGLQTAVLTTRTDMRGVEVAWRMFERWRQENFFRYMREHFALDALVDRDAEAVEGGRTVVNPKRRRLDKELTKLRTELRKLESRYGQRAVENKESQRPTVRGFKIANGKLGSEIRALRGEYEKLLARRRQQPKRVAVEELDEEDRIVQLKPEAKHLTDTIKMLAYRAETVLVQLLEPGYARSEDESRALVRALLRSPADVLPDRQAGLLRVRLHGMPNGRSNTAVTQLCQRLNEAEVKYPGTQLTLRYESLVDA